MARFSMDFSGVLSKARASSEGTGEERARRGRRVRARVVNFMVGIWILMGVLKGWKKVGLRVGGLWLIVGFWWVVPVAFIYGLDLERFLKTLELGMVAFASNLDK